MFKRPDPLRFNFLGVNTNDPSDALPIGKYTYAQNVRGVMGSSIRTRPGYTQLTIGKYPVLNIRTYSALFTDNLPRYLTFNSDNNIYLDTGIPIGPLAGTSYGASMIPYRPNRSPQPYMYVATDGDYQKFSAPDTLNNVTQSNVGIREPSSPPNAAPNQLSFYDFSSIAASWANAGTAGVIADAVRVSDTATAIFVDPNSSSTRYSIQVATTKSYQVGEILSIAKSGGGSFKTVVEDVIPPIIGGTIIAIKSIYYFSGTTGRCIIVPTQMSADASIPTINSTNIPSATSVFSASLVSSLRRGALISFATHAEICLVLSVSPGPDGSLAIECVTTNNHAVSETLSGIPAIVVGGINATVVGQAITSADMTSTLTGAGTGTLTQALATNPFIQVLSPSPVTVQSDDYICFGIQIADMSKLIQGQITFDIKNGVADYTTDAYYYIFNTSNIILPTEATVTGAVNNIIGWMAYGNVFATEQEAMDFAFPDGVISIGVVTPIYSTAGLTNTSALTTLTPLPASQWSTVMIPISGLTRIGNDLTRSLANCQGVQISLQTSTSAVIGISSFWIGGGGQCDVANNSPYFYSWRGLSSLTGAVSNPSPIMRYGVSPRRQTVRVEITDTISDSQFDLVEIFRYGGTITSWRSLGMTPKTAGTMVFTDNSFDTAANAGSIIEYNNLQPWPTIGLPFNINAGTSSGVTTVITSYGTLIVATSYSASPFTSPFPSNITRWLPGTILLMSGSIGRTLRSRPTSLTLSSPPAAYYYSYVFEIIECLSASTPSSLSVLEPNIAAQPLPYLWGPNAQNDIMAAGDPYRPGSIYFIKENMPDSAPSNYNLEISAPSEPILGGEVINGMSLCASAFRWWALYPSFDTAQRYYKVERSIGRGLAAPYGHCGDGRLFWFWTKDGIWESDGSSGKSITDTDLYNIFPHEGTVGEDYTYAGHTIYAPDYRYAIYFRLGICNGFLYATYRDSQNTPRTLVYDTHLSAWCPSVYADSITVHHGVEQQEGTLLSAVPSLYPKLLLGDDEGNVYQESDLSNDDDTEITSIIGTVEFGGGDPRADILCNDVIVDTLPISAITVTPLSQGVAITSATVIPVSSTRSRNIVPVGVESKFIGLLLSWTDDFTLISSPTVLYLWQSLLQILPIKVQSIITSAMGFGIPGYKSIYKIIAAYKSSAPVTLSITAYDGQSPTSLTLPSTGGVLKKDTFILSPNKGRLFTFSSSGEWTPHLDEWEIHVASWGRQTQCYIAKDISQPTGVG